MAVRCMDCDSGRAAKLNVKLCVGGNKVVYAVVICDDCYKQHLEDGGKPFYNVCVKP